MEENDSTSITLKRETKKMLEQAFVKFSAKTGKKVGWDEFLKELAVMAEKRFGGKP